MYICIYIYIYIYIMKENIDSFNRSAYLIYKEG